MVRSAIHHGGARHHHESSNGISRLCPVFLTIFSANMVGEERQDSVCSQIRGTEQLATAQHDRISQQQLESASFANHLECRKAPFVRHSRDNFEDV